VAVAVIPILAVVAAAAWSITPLKSSQAEGLTLLLLVLVGLLANLEQIQFLVI
jgi:hypothetical protein